MTKSNYSDEKNPWSKFVQKGWMVNEQYDAWRSGYLVGEKEKADELAFTEEEKAFVLHAYERLHANDVVGVSKNDFKALESLKKKVLGE